MSRVVLLLALLAIAATASAASAAEERADYQARVQEQIDDWRDRLKDFADQANKRSATAGGQANARVTDAWHEVNDRWREFRAAGPQDWEDAKKSLDTALETLEQAWQARGTKSDDDDAQARRSDRQPFFHAINVATRMQT